MGIRVNTNIASLSAQRHLYNTTTNFQKSMEKLSSGMRINRAGDDAAGLAISESLRSDIRAMQQASRNAADGISLVQVGEGALDEVSNILIRMKELAEQSINGTLGNSERAYLDSERISLEEEIDRIAAGTEFNGVFLLSGGAGTVDIQVGIGSTPTDRVQIDLGNPMDAAAIGISTGIDTALNAQAAMAEVDGALAAVSSIRANFGAVQNRLETSIRNIGMTTENLAAANSRIRDVDVALETSNMTSLQILQQAGVSILTQANNTSQLALSLMQR
ncbi:MAG: flagellin FliC [bacterium]|nr:flagellin FliC [bacterium]